MIALQMSWQTSQPVLPTQQQGMWAMWNMIVNDMMQQSNKTQNWTQSLSNIAVK
jgi:hypothetical protein